MRFTIRDLLWLICAVLMASNAAAAQEAEYTAEGEAFGVSYSSYVFRESLEKTPRWERNAEHPPVSARRALRIAEKEAGIVSAREGYERRVHQVALVPVRDRWIWEVSFIWKGRVGGGTGIPDYLQVIILMDGSAIKPTPDGQRRH